MVLRIRISSLAVTGCRDPGTNSLAAQASWRGGCEGRKRQAGCRAPPEPEELTTCKDCARESLAPKTSAPHHTPPKHLPPRPPRMLQGSCKLLLGPARPKEKASPDNLGGRFINTPPHMRNEITLRLRHGGEPGHEKRSRGPAGHCGLRWPWPRAPRCLPRSVSWFFHRMAPALLQLSGRPAAPNTTQSHTHTRSSTPGLRLRPSLCVRLSCQSASARATQLTNQLSRSNERSGPPPHTLWQARLKPGHPPIKRKPRRRAPSGSAHCSVGVEIQRHQAEGVIAAKPEQRAAWPGEQGLG